MTEGHTTRVFEPLLFKGLLCSFSSLLKTLTNYPKLLVAGVSGDAVDFGVLILSYFDLVYASDKATFQTNYVKNGYLPECLQLFPKNRLVSFPVRTFTLVYLKQYIRSDLL